MKKIIIIISGVLFFTVSFAYMNAGYGMYYGSDVREEQATNASYVPPQREFINQRYGEDIDNNETSFDEDSDGNQLFMSYNQP